MHNSKQQRMFFNVVFILFALVYFWPVHNNELYHTQDLYIVCKIDCALLCYHRLSDCNAYMYIANEIILIRLGLHDSMFFWEFFFISNEEKKKCG